MRAADACPGVLRPHRAEDGAMVRLRLPGGRISAGALRRLGELAAAYGNGILQLTSRAGVQLRGLPDPLPAAFVDAVAAAGVLPALSHERVRNIVASPLTGVSGGRADVGPLTVALDAGLVAEAALAELPGRFLFVLDDGRGDVVDLTFDLGYQAGGPDGGLVLVGSAERGLPVRTADVVPTLLHLALDFATARADTGAWRVAELPAWMDSLGLDPITPVRDSAATPLGRIGSVASVSVPLARLTLEQARLVEDVVAGGQVVITPWRGLVLPGAGGRLADLGAGGLVIDDDTAWAQVSACVGGPFCTRARIDTTEIATALVSAGGRVPRTHVSGCERRCGAPTGGHVDLVAPTLAGALRAVGGGR
ncbi:MAG TPA: precorrin-3B synthase [Microlunatus sp.]